jgi:hypothetical protein
MKDVVKRGAAASTSSKYLLFWTAIWAVLLYVIGACAARYFPFDPTYPYYDGLLAPLAPAWIARWAGFDGVHYITIIENGYFGTGLIQAFFPVYPLLVKLLDFIKNPLITGMIISLISLMCSIVVFAKLVVRNVAGEIEKKRVLVGAMFALLTFPTSYFFLGLYTESLFFLLVLLTFFLMHQKKWLMAGVVAGIASGTRVVGVALFPALLMQAYFDNTAIRKHALPWRNWLIALISLGGLLFYMLYLQRVFNDPMYFLHVQNAFGGGRQETFVLFPQVLFRYIKILSTVNPFTWAYYSYLQEFFVTAEVGIVLLVATVKKLVPWSYLTFSWLAYLIPPLTGTFQSMPRYVLILFPLYLIYARWFAKGPIPMSALFFLHAILLVVNIVLFFEGKWVA